MKLNTQSKKNNNTGFIIAITAGTYKYGTGAKQTMSSDTEKRFLKYYLKTWKKNTIIDFNAFEKFNWADECDKEIG